ncbi:DUF742 domain-containing protein [Pseudonocardia ailaonensis]|uniref:DUF742 domain-containing protein n=1 Tax=Pseudonocardia ailaonensis TaxID=367279 RepID=A0ABN2NN08_9PSEU
MAVGGQFGHGRAGGRVVPVFAVTGGRTRSAGEEFPVESLVTVTAAGRHAAELQLEYRTILGLAAAPVSLVEIGATLAVPVGVARVLVGDLADAGYVSVHLPQVDRDGSPGPEILERLLEGLRARSG